MDQFNSKENTPHKRDPVKDPRLVSPRQRSDPMSNLAIVQSSASPCKNAEWTHSEFTTLLSKVRQKGEDWEQIASEIKTKTPEECKRRFRPSQKHSKKGNWTDAEDKILLEWVALNGSARWTECSRLIPNRCGKQCRERWVNILNPNIKKGEWTAEEQLTLFRYLPKFTTSWSLMAQALPGRTENSIKNYFYSSMRRLKASPVVHLIYDIHVNKRTSPEDLAKDNPFLKSELEKLNAFGRAICEYLLGKYVEAEFKRFLLGLLFDGCPQAKTAQMTGRPFLVEPVVVKKALTRDGTGETGVALRNALEVRQLRERNAKAVSEVLKSLSEANHMGYLGVFIKTLEQGLQAAVAKGTGEGLTIDIDTCWECPK